MCLPRPAYISGVVVFILFLHRPLLSALGLASCPACSGEKNGDGSKGKMQSRGLSHQPIIFFLKFIILFIWLSQVLVAACKLIVAAYGI